MEIRLLVAIFPPDWAEARRGTCIFTTKGRIYKNDGHGMLRLNEM
jgi:hypothetical protein